MTSADTAIIEERLHRIEAILVALPCIARKGEIFPGAIAACEVLGLMAGEEMAKVKAALGTEVLNRDC